MATNTPNTIHAEALRKTKVETTYEYVPILGAILGFWRKASEMRFGNTIELHLKTPIGEYDRLYINGQEIPIPKEVKPV